MERYVHEGSDLAGAVDSIVEKLPGAPISFAVLGLDEQGPAVGFGTLHPDRSDEFVANLMLATAHQLVTQAAKMIELPELEFLLRSFNNVGEQAGKLVNCDCPRCREKLRDVSRSASPASTSTPIAGRTPPFPAPTDRRPTP